MSELQKLIAEARLALADENAANVVGAHATGIVFSRLHEHHDMPKGKIADHMGISATEVSKRLTIALYDLDFVTDGVKRAGQPLSVNTAYDFARFFRDGKLTKSGKFPTKKVTAPPAVKFDASRVAGQLRKQYTKRQLDALVKQLSA